MHDQIPTPAPQHDILARMAGTWEGDERMLPSPWCPDEQARQGACTGRMLDGFFLISDYVQRDGEAVTFQGHGVYSWDAQKEQYAMYWFDSMGGAGSVSYGDLADNVLTFRNTSPMGEHRYQYTFHEDGTYTFEMAMSQDGESWNDLMRAVYRNASSA